MTQISTELNGHCAITKLDSTHIRSIADDFPIKDHRTDDCIIVDNTNHSKIAFEYGNFLMGTQDDSSPQMQGDPTWRGGGGSKHSQ